MADLSAFLSSFTTGIFYPANVLAAHDTISGIYQHVLPISARKDADPLRLSFHCDTITSEPVTTSTPRGHRGRSCRYQFQSGGLAHCSNHGPRVGRKEIARFSCELTNNVPVTGPVNHHDPAV
ncbi:hypothetical protein EV363DRAFT_1165434 [Boletus edulis]|nr:hypothetical protein EV363DRAFT_1165434 [Boletus edulis]